jgi:hypothetical protein
VSRSITLPPYGLFSNTYLAKIAREPVPPAWRLSTGAAPDRERAWAMWRDAVADEIVADLWPRFDPVTATWRPDDPQRQLALTTADLDLLLEMQAVRPLLFDQPPDSPRASANAPNHRVLFRYEDGDRPLGSYHAVYDHSLPSRLLDELPKLLQEALGTHIGSASLQFKQQFQRPRAYQASLMLGRTEFHYELGLTSMTSAMSSGHALQGCLLGLAAAAAWRRSGLSLDDESYVALQQYAVDIGDRRVLAGIHYPSDNLASWWIALRMTAAISDDHADANFVQSAIIERSFVFRLVRARAEGRPDHPYARSLQRILGWPGSANA